MSTAVQKTKRKAVENAPKPMKWYMTQDGVNLYDLFAAGIQFGQAHMNYVEGRKWTEMEWYDALEAALPPDFMAKLDEQARKRHGR